MSIMECIDYMWLEIVIVYSLTALAMISISRISTQTARHRDVGKKSSAIRRDIYGNEC